MDNSTIKENIRKYRKAKKLTQEQMAHGLDISLTAYRDIERGRTSIVNNDLAAIADLLDTSAEEIVLGYRPVRPEVNLQEVHTEYGEKIMVLERRIADLEKLVRLLEETLESKNEIIAMLKKSLDGVK